MMKKCSKCGSLDLLIFKFEGEYYCSKCLFRLEKFNAGEHIADIYFGSDTELKPQYVAEILEKNEDLIDDEYINYNL